MTIFYFCGVNNSNQVIQEFYTPAALYESIVNSFSEKGILPDQITRDHLLAVDEFHIQGLKATKEIIANAGIEEEMKILDAGCGIGGTCRMLADVYNCQVTGIDLSFEYIRTARLLSNLLNMQHVTRFQQSDVCKLPFEDASFDCVISQHVQINVEDKDLFVSEVYRVLKPGGKFIYYDVFQISEMKILFPVPWADREETSFLVSPEKWDQILNLNGFISKSRDNRTASGIQFLDQLIKKMDENNLPKPGLDLLMGDTYSEKIRNVYSNLIQGIIILQSGIEEKETQRE
ncbi:MAG: class I SAM-dependent methyltransferase [Bacteroidota bacterium]